MAHRKKLPLTKVPSSDSSPSWGVILDSSNWRVVVMLDCWRINTLRVARDTKSGRNQWVPMRFGVDDCPYSNLENETIMSFF